jgi:urease accessory protein
VNDPGAPARSFSATETASGWHGLLRLHYRRDGERTVAHDAHEGPLRVLRALHPEGPGVCHHVLVHPPGGIVGGDRLAIEARLDAGAHALVTTPGATRFYRSAGQPAVQQADLTLAAGARLEWLPLETIAYPGCLARNVVRLALAPGAEMIGWDLLALGLPASGQPFEAGSFEQDLAWPGVWIERGHLDAGDAALLDGAVGLAGQRVLASAWFAAGMALESSRRGRLLDAARAALDATPLPAGATSPDARVIVVRVLGARVEPVMAALAAVRAVWREAAWGLAANPPRVWRT